VVAVEVEEVEAVEVEAVAEVEGAVDAVM